MDAGVDAAGPPELRSLEQAGQEAFGPGGFLIEVEKDQGMGGDQQAKGEEGEEEGGGVDGADEDRGDDEGPESHEKKGHNMGVDADGDVGSIGGVDKMAVGDGLPGVVPVEDTADDEAILVEAADVGAGGVADQEGEVLARFEVGFQALADLHGREMGR